MGTRLYREIQLSHDAIDVEARTITLTFSSETPVARWYYEEVLDHSKGAVCMDFIASGRAPLLWAHDMQQQIGVIERAEITPERTGRAVVRFSKNQRADEIFQDVQDKIISCVSVGYEPRSMVLQSRADDALDRYLVDDWEPLEISLVSIPADQSVGVGRSRGDNPHIAKLMEAAQAKARAKDAQPPQIITEPGGNMAMPENGADAERQRSATLLALSDQYSNFGAREMVAEFIRGGKTPEEFKDAIMAKITARHSNVSDIKIGMTDQETERYSLCRAIAASITGDWSKAGLERAASETLAKRVGKTPSGFYMPVEVARRSFNAGTQNEGGNLIQTTVAGDEFIDVFRNALVLQKLGVRILGGLTSNLALPKKISKIAIQALTETGAITPDRPLTGQVLLSPHRLGGQIIASKQTVIQGGIDVESMLNQEIMDSLAESLESQAFNSPGTGGSARGLFYQPGIGAVVCGPNGGAPGWSHVVGMETVCTSVNANPDARAGYVINAKGKGALKMTQKAANLPFIWMDGEFPLNGYRAFTTNTLPSNLSKGTAVGTLSQMAFSTNWSDMLIGLFGGIDVVVDAITRANSGEIVLTANQYFDVGVRQAGSFTVITDALV